MRMRGRLAARSDARGARRHACVHLRGIDVTRPEWSSLSGRSVPSHRERIGKASNVDSRPLVCRKCRPSQD